MSEALTEHTPSAEAKPALAAGFRIDPPHVFAGSSTDVHAGAAPDMVDDTPRLTIGLVQQLRTQAEQLSAHLRTQEKDLEQREALLNARMAEIDTQTRSARLWLRERQEELRAQAEELQRQRGEAGSTRRGKVADSQSRTESKDHELSQREAELRQQRQQLDAERAALQQQREEWLVQLKQFDEPSPHRARSANEEPHAALQQFLARQQYLDQAESLIAEQRGQLADQLQELEYDRAQHVQRVKADRRTLTLQQRQRDAELEKTRQALDIRAEKLETRRVALDELRTDLTRMHRETLEMRLSVEELWAQMAGVVPPARLTMALGQTRSQLAEHYRGTQLQLDAQKKDLEEMAARLADKHDKLAAERRELQSWLQLQRAELQEQAARLAAREEQLDQAEADRLTQTRAWQQERARYQQQLRDLLDNARRPTAA